MNFFVTPGSGEMTLPLSSLRFLADVCLAYAWLHENGQQTQRVVDYLLTLKYQWPEGFRGARHQPLAALGVPANAADDPRVESLRRKLVGTGMVFVVGHEPSLYFAGSYLGHWVDLNGNTVDARMLLRRTGDRVQGEYDFGGGPASITGVVVDNRLHYVWRWGSDHFGRGVMRIEASGATLRGTWGYTDREAGGGEWALTRDR